MSLKDQITEDMKTAMRAKDALRRLHVIGDLVFEAHGSPWRGAGL